MAIDTSNLSYYYPSDLFTTNPKWIWFKVKSGRHILRSGTLDVSNQSDRIVKSVALYLPSDALQSTLTAKWDTVDLGAAGAVVEGAFQKAGGTPARSGAVPISNMSDANIGSAIAGGALSGAVTAGINKTMSEISAKLGEGSTAAGQAVTGVTPNPRTDVLFQSVSYRQHNFTFQLMPRNENEAIAIDGILNVFQYYMLPSFGNITFIGYPYEFEIDMFTQHSGKHHINTIDRSVLTECTINHAPTERVAFIKNGEYYPASTSLRLTFQEVRLQGRDKQYSIWRGKGDGDGGVRDLNDFTSEENDPLSRTIESE